MFSKSCQNILFSKVYSTLLFRKESLSPISGYGPEALLNLIIGWYKFARITAEPKQLLHRDIVEVTLGYYSIYSSPIELYKKLLYIKENIALDVIQSSGYMLSEKEQMQYAVLVELLTLLVENLNKIITCDQEVG